MFNPFDYCTDSTISFKRLLKDSEIIEAIKRRIIVLDDPELYLSKRRDELIQPASMDLLLEGSDELQVIAGKVANPKRNSYPPVPHEDLNNEFVTFWPNYITEVLIKHLRSYDSFLVALPELRSSLRRVGLDIGFNPRGIGFAIDEGGFGYFNIRNPQDYPVSIRKGEKIAQVLWSDLGYKAGEGIMCIEERTEKYGTGKMITNRSELQRLVDDGDIFLSDNDSIGEGVILFHAGRIRSYCAQNHVIFDQGSITGFVVNNHDSATVIQPGIFTDIETTEKISLSPKVAVHVLYHYEPSLEGYDFLVGLNRHNTLYSSGGWIDPGYGFSNPNGAPFSVQRKAFTKPINIRPGELVGFGVVYKFPEPVEKPYGKNRGSHYNEDQCFVGPKV